MARICDITGRKTSFGHKKKHRRGSSGGGGAWRFKAPTSNRRWLPNLRTVKVVKDGKIETITVSMKAYKKLRTVDSLKGYSLVKVTPKASKSVK